MEKLLLTLVASTLILVGAQSTPAAQKSTPGNADLKFAQLETLLPTPSNTRTASGSPGPQYWQQRANYRIKATLDEKNRRLNATAAITYTNNSPDTLSYLWLQLDQNIFKDESLSRRSQTKESMGTRRDIVGPGDSLTFNAMRRHQSLKDREYGYEIGPIKDSTGHTLHSVINDTMMRVDLAQSLAPGASITINLTWAFNIIDEAPIGGRSGYEYFPKTDTYQYFIAQWFPRLAAYTDYTGWQHKQFLERGEFTLEFGDYDVELTVPSDHIVASTGTLQNAASVLTVTQRERLKKAGAASTPIFIITPAEALANENKSSKKTKVWRFKAENVRDFAFASSNKYIWDAMGYKQKDTQQPFVLAQSFYPNEAEPIWSKFSTLAVIHTMEVYSRFSFPYPYPTAQSVNSWETGGMEYPMISFNGYRPKLDEKNSQITYSRNTKYGLIGVIIHEVGHNYFPMIVNSDERQWSWMDEGINTFLEYLTELEWDEKYPAFGTKTNVLDYITTYMKSNDQVPVMTNSESIVQFGPNAYFKPTAALVVLREAVMGRELFDYAFREYSNRWKFKRPTPSDFFRTMEDASAVDLDWFWRGWFYGTDYVDISVGQIREYQVSSQDPDKEFALRRTQSLSENPETIIIKRNRDEHKIIKVQELPQVKDIYDTQDEFTVTNKDRNEYRDFREKLKPWEVVTLDRAIKEGEYIYFVDFENIGGLVSPLPLTLKFLDGSIEELMLPAEIWRYNAKFMTKIFIRNKRLIAVELDNKHIIADADVGNNATPRKLMQSRVELFKSKDKSQNLMLDLLTELKAEKNSPKAPDTALPIQPTMP